jgi:hypothetical protein
MLSSRETSEIPFDFLFQPAVPASTQARAALSLFAEKILAANEWSLAAVFSH